jgi:hypothetical protein
MPFRHLTSGRFDLDTLKLMQQAFDTVCAKLQIDGDDSRRLTLANEIIRLAGEGTREQLAKQAEETLALPTPPPPLAQFRPTVSPAAQRSSRTALASPGADHRHGRGRKCVSASYKPAMIDMALKVYLAAGRQQSPAWIDGHGTEP